ncbi:hypothetical protein SAMN05421747_10842 [Parapedobacter composti]|uniref:Probable membrane transporter protein n=1 Tax=Parapedobacter composti TaxID=623281 RepID=A0A1I1I400_9SPHI|nr:sulfite exporter TauE/SafE family protein [Parapedobacter composti]SFC30906.1 hypothetical protein SAMN05421747_10842 [Parapedobacter composti]
MDILVLSLAAFAVALLTFFSGFGLGTILTPVFMVFFSVDLAVALTGVVHFFNNLFKLVLVGGRADRQVLIRFGIPAVIAAFFGAWLLLQVSDLAPLFSYSIGGEAFEVYPMKLVIAVLLMGFAVMDLIPYFSNLAFGKAKLPIGGLLSGFFGGFSGNQGALRSAFLVRVGLSKEAFVATTVVISTFVDFTRLSVYATRFAASGLHDNLLLVGCATVSAILGAYLGNRLLKKVTLRFIRILVAVMLIVIAMALGAGII